MMRRGETAKFMPNSYVFPGGLLDKNDINFPRSSTNFNLVDAQPIEMQGYEDDYAFRVAALRELFEEAGILLTFNANTRLPQLITEKDDPNLLDWRKKVTLIIRLLQQFSIIFDVCMCLGA
jgi:8-oxo-dGTP pyrophosphatase MutT (NUDIX family)